MGGRELHHLVDARSQVGCGAAWYLNILDHADVTIHDRDQFHELHARVATPEDRAALWPIAVAEWPAYDDYQTKTDREIPLVICEPR